MESSSSDRLNEIKNERPYTPVILYWEKSVNGRKEVNGVWYIHEATLKHVRAGMTPFDTANLGLPQYTFDLRALEDRFVEVTPDHLITPPGKDLRNRIERLIEEESMVQVTLRTTIRQAKEPLKVVGRFYGIRKDLTTLSGAVNPGLYLGILPDRDISLVFPPGVTEREKRVEYRVRASKKSRGAGIQDCVVGLPLNPKELTQPGNFSLKKISY